jgi:hypothetical protein
MIALCEFAKTTLALLVFTWMGTAGLVDDIEVREKGVLAHAPLLPSFAAGDVAFYGNRGRDNADHEYGHLIHEDELGILYLPIAGLTSLIGNGFVAMGKINAEGYFNLWAERKADEYGGVDR